MLRPASTADVMPALAQYKVAARNKNLSLPSPSHKLPQSPDIMYHGYLKRSAVIVPQRQVGRSAAMAGGARVMQEVYGSHRKKVWLCNTSLWPLIVGRVPWDAG